jgi:hypothetical protein
MISSSTIPSIAPFIVILNLDIFLLMHICTLDTASSDNLRNKYQNMTPHDHNSVFKTLNINAGLLIINK